MWACEMLRSSRKKTSQKWKYELKMYVIKIIIVIKSPSKCRVFFLRRMKRKKKLKTSKFQHDKVYFDSFFFLDFSFSFPADMCVCSFQSRKKLEKINNNVWILLLFCIHLSRDENAKKVRMKKKQRDILKNFIFIY